MKCDYCESDISMWENNYRVGGLTVCVDCKKNHREEIIQRVDSEKEPKKIDPKELDGILLTTESHLKDLKIQERLGIVSSEAALGMNIFRDIFAGVRDIVGGQSSSTQKVLKALKNTALQGLRKEAYFVGANAVVAIDLDYSEFSGGGKSMLFLVITGTAVII